MNWIWGTSSVQRSLHDRRTSITCGWTAPTGTSTTLSNVLQLRDRRSSLHFDTSTCRWTQRVCQRHGPRRNVLQLWDVDCLHTERAPQTCGTNIDHLVNVLHLENLSGKTDHGNLRLRHDRVSTTCRINCALGVAQERACQPGPRTARLCTCHCTPTGMSPPGPRTAPAELHGQHCLDHKPSLAQQRARHQTNTNMDIVHKDEEEHETQQNAASTAPPHHNRHDPATAHPPCRFLTEPQPTLALATKVPGSASTSPAGRRSPWHGHRGVSDKPSFVWLTPSFTSTELTGYWAPPVRQTGQPWWGVVVVVLKRLKRGGCLCRQSPETNWQGRALDGEELFTIEGSKNWRSTPGQPGGARKNGQKGQKPRQTAWPP